MSVVSCTLLADWQAVPYDKCTEFSLYHRETISANHIVNYSDTPIFKRYSDERLSSLELGSTLHEKTVCKIAGSEQILCSWGCYLVQDPANSFKIQKHPCGELKSIKYNSIYICKWNQSVPFCMFIDHNTHQHHAKPPLPTIQYSLKENVYKDLQTQCTQSTFNGNYCHWTPNSLITKQYCNECQPICRSLSHSLNFVQFCLGAAILMVSIPIAWVPVASIISERTRSEMQVLHIYVPRIILLQLFFYT